MLALLTPKTWDRQEGHAARVLLYGRSGRELDRVDSVIPGSVDGVHPRLERSGRTGVRFRVSSRGQDPPGPIVIRTRSGTRRTDREGWPAGWEERGVARVVARDGRLEVEPPGGSD